MVVVEARVQHDVHQPLDSSRPTNVNGWDTGHRCGIEDAVAEDPEAPTALGNQHRAVRQESDGPRLLQPPGYDNKAQLAFLCGFEINRAFG